MTYFWMICGVLTLGIGAMLWRAMNRSDLSGQAIPDIEIYKAQLAEVERDVARGVLSESEADQLRTEVKRRLLNADKSTSGAEFHGGGPSLLGYVGLAGVAAIAVGTYWTIGAPGYGDLPLDLRKELTAEAAAARPSQDVAQRSFAETQFAPPASPELLALVEQLRVAMQDRPDDVRGLELLARNEAILGNYDDAIAAQERLIAVKGDATTARDIADLAELMIVATGGYVSPQAEERLRQALAVDPTLGAARYYLGSMYDQTGRPDEAFRIWQRLLLEEPDNAPWSQPIRDQIDAVALRAGVTRYEQPPSQTRRGPSAADIAAADDMSPEDRTQMIQNMVAGLSQRLAEEGGPPSDWARLIAAYGVLGAREQAEAVLIEARLVFQGNDGAQALLDDAAARAGITE
ncbi:c-type cytochrome biogenesis protein CcmI [Shimia ponticola]|uniref:c-type cytochrome biogenesis protein CcmI n=1 Tax=Shimia ponticola TaxID=2582893 RepID=UPI0011BEA6D3|nr:c-type cytochrome biogenesis protein CcmI [Shimia ponticola]